MVKDWFAILLNGRSGGSDAPLKFTRYEAACMLRFLSKASYMIEIKSNGDSKRKKSKSSSQHVEEKRMRYSQECEKSRNSNKINNGTNDHVQLKMQNAPYRLERFEEMIKRKKNELQQSVQSPASGKLVTNTLSKEENLNETDFDVTQWQNTLWMKGNKHLGLSSFHESDCSKEIVDQALKVDANPNEIPGETLEENVEKGSYLMRPGVISLGIDSIELAAALTAIIILLFTINFKNWNMFYPLCNTLFTASIVVWLTITHFFHLFVEINRNDQGVVECYIPISKKYMFLYEHITRCVFTLTSIAQIIYFAVKSTHRLLFYLLTTMLIIHFCSAFIHLYFATKNRFILSLNSNK